MLLAITPLPLMIQGGLVLPSGFAVNLQAVYVPAGTVTLSWAVVGSAVAEPLVVDEVPGSVAWGRLGWW